MSFTQNAKKIVTDTAETVVKASGELIETSKIKYRIYDANIDMKRLYEKLGKITYSEYKGDTDNAEDKEELCIKIRELEAYLEELNEKLNK